MTLSLPPGTKSRSESPSNIVILNVIKNQSETKT